MRRLILGLVLISAVVLFAIPLLADRNEISGQCTLPAQSGISMKVVASVDGPTLASGTTGGSGNYSFSIQSLTSGNYYYFHATDGVGEHLWYFYYSGGDLTHNFQLSV